MRFVWLTDSLSLNTSKSKPLEECNDKYTWEVGHAETVVKKRKVAAKAKLRAAKQAEEQEREHLEEGDVDDAANGMSTDNVGQRDGVACEVLRSRDESASKLSKVNLDIKHGLKKERNQGGVQKRRSIDKKTADAKKLQQIFEYGMSASILD